MLSSDLVKRLDLINRIAVQFVPPDADIVGFSVSDDAGRFELDVSMQDSLDMAQKYRDILAEALTEQNIPFVLSEIGRRSDDKQGEYIFTTKDFILKAVNFSQWATQLALTTVGPEDSGDPEIEKFINDTEANGGTPPPTE